MYTINYPEKRTFEQFDNEHFLLYLNEQPVEYISEHLELEGDHPAADPEPVNGFSYTGTLEDGGTLITAKEATYEAFVSGLIRLKYSADEVEALQSNMTEALRDSKNPRAGEFTERWEKYQSYREECKTNARKALNL